MPTGSLRGFGLLIAYVLPGFTLLLGLATVSETLRLWLFGSCGASLAVGGVLYVTAASITLGMIINVARWLMLDTLHGVTGIPRPTWNFALLTTHLASFDRLVDDHFRFYQFYSNMLLASVPAFAIWRASDAPSGLPAPLPEIALLLLCIALVAASRDALRKYYDRTSILLHQIEETTMTNGNHPKPKDSTRPAKEAKSPVPRARPSPPSPRSNPRGPLINTARVPNKACGPLHPETPAATSTAQGM